MRSTRLVNITGLFIMFLSSIAVAADPLPLSHGIFVESSVGCSDVSNATALSYSGDELNSSKVIGTIVRVKKSNGSYRVTLDMNVQGEPSGQEIWTVKINGVKNMTVMFPYGTSSYRWCFHKMP